MTTRQGKKIATGKVSVHKTVIQKMSTVASGFAEKCSLPVVRSVFIENIFMPFLSIVSIFLDKD